MHSMIKEESMINMEICINGGMTRRFESLKNELIAS